MTKRIIEPEEMAAGLKLIQPFLDSLSGLTNEELGLAREAFAKADEDTVPWILCAFRFEMLPILAIEAATRKLRPEEWLVMPDDIKEIMAKRT